MTNKTTEAYVSVYEHIFSVIAPQFHVYKAKVHTDFEIAERKAVKVVLPNATNELCVTHFDRVRETIQIDWLKTM